MRIFDVKDLPERLRALIAIKDLIGRGVEEGERTALDGPVEERAVVDAAA